MSNTRKLKNRSDTSRQIAELQRMLADAKASLKDLSTLTVKFRNGNRECAVFAGTVQLTEYSRVPDSDG